MKFDTLEKDAQVTGDVKSNNVSIDTNNINFIVTILSTNLYSKPIESFIRETVSNAWDSHIEAGITEPVILELGKDTEGKFFCRVQDFGVGLSPERFNHVYRNIGSSTKRSDNNQIGGFGIGRFSALAYSDVVHITSNFEGVKYKYMMYKDGNSISIDLLHEQETDERNGLEVQLELKNGESEILKFYEAIKKQLVYFENLYFIDSTNTGVNYIPKDEFNNFHIKKYKDFLVNDLDSSNRKIDLVLGKVRYPLRIESLSKSYPMYVSNYPVSLRFNIGDLEVTPNREEILYSQKNIDKIQHVLDESIKELDEIFEAHSNKDFTSLGDYVEAIQHSHQAPLLEVDGVNKVYISINSNELKITLNGQKHPKDIFLKLYNHIMSASLIPVPYEMYGNKLNYISGHTNLNHIKSNFNKVYYSDVASLNNMSKTYIRETFESNTKFIHSGKNVKFFYKKYLESIRNYTKKGNYNNATYDYKSSKAIMQYLVQNVLNIKKFSDKTVPQSYIDKKKADNKAKRALMKNAGIDWSQNVNMFNLRASNVGMGNVATTNEAMSLSKIREKYRKLTIYSEKDDAKLRTLFNITMNTNKVNFVEVAPTRQKLLSGFENFVKIEDFMDVKYKLIRQIGTARLIEEELPYINRLLVINQSLGKISTKLQSIVMDLANYNERYLANKNSIEEKQLITEIYNLCLEKNYFDEDIRGVLNANLSMLKNAEALLLFVDSGAYQHTIPDNRINVVVDYVLSRKLFRPDVAAVLKLKNETILNIKKDESN